jgi:hypothetical protein
MNTPKSRSIPVEYIKQCFEYREEVVDGVLQGNVYWKHCEDKPKSWNARYADKKAGHSNHHRDYRNIRITYKNIKCDMRLHRIIFILNHNRYPVGVIDHIDRKTNNNLIENLEECPQRDNANNRGANSNSSSHFRGVYFQKNMALKKWCVQVEANGKRTPSVYFIDELEAAEYANKLLIENFGDVKNLYQNDISNGYTNKAYPNMPRHWVPEEIAA